VHPELQGSSEVTLRVDRADLVPTRAQPAGVQQVRRAGRGLPPVLSGGERAAARWDPAGTGDALAEEHSHLHVLWREPYTVARGRDAQTQLSESSERRRGLSELKFTVSGASWS
jgi:hypothetical protein